MSNRNFYLEAAERARCSNDDAGIHFFDSTVGDFHFVSYSWLFKAAEDWASKLGVVTGTKNHIVLIATHTPYSTLVAFLGAMSRRMVPLIVPEPKAMGGIRPHLERIRNLTADFSSEYLIVAQDSAAVPNYSQFGCPVVPAPSLSANMSDQLTAREMQTASDELAFFQSTSASTGTSKLITITHNSLIANIEGMHQALGFGANEVMVTWLPLYHDMGLIGGALLGIMKFQTIALMSPLDFLKRPDRWLTSISRFRATITVAPNFGYDYAAKYANLKDTTIDLRSLKCAMVGAEPILTTSLSAFARKFSGFGLRPHVFMGCYGMAESTLACTLEEWQNNRSLFASIDMTGVRPGASVNVHRIGRFDATDPPDRPDAKEVTVFGAGRPIPGLTVALVDDQQNRISADNVLGEIQIAGNSLSPGYFSSRHHAISPISQSGFLTGDLGFFNDGTLYVVGRKKNTIIRNGQNYHSSQIEDAIGRILDLSAHSILVLELNILDADSSVVAVIEGSLERNVLPESQKQAIKGLDVPLAALYFFRKRIIPRTTSGKKQYHTCRQQLFDGELVPDSIVSLSL